MDNRVGTPDLLDLRQETHVPITANTTPDERLMDERLTAGRLTHLQRLEAEAIQIMREAVSESDNPAMLYSIGKDSSVMLHLAMKAFYPSKPPFPLVHVDTTWKFHDMYQFRDDTAARLGVELVVHQNPECVARGINPFDHGSAVHTDMWKTEGLKQVIDDNKFDLCFGGARRDEEKSRAKERIFSVRSRAAPVGPEAPTPRAVADLQRPPLQRRDAARVPDLELDRTRRVAVHPPRADPDRAAVLLGAAAGGRPRRHADHGRRRPHAAA